MQLTAFSHLAKSELSPIEPCACCAKLPFQKKTSEAVNVSLIKSRVCGGCIKRPAIKVEKATQCRFLHLYNRLHHPLKEISLFYKLYKSIWSFRNSQIAWIQHMPHLVHYQASVAHDPWGYNAIPNIWSVVWAKVTYCDACQTAA